MAKLQKKKPSTDKFKKKETSATSEEVPKKTGDNKPSVVSLFSPSKNSVKNLKTMTAQSVPEGELNFFQKAVQYIREVQAELKKVTWPNKKQTAGSTVVVIILVFIIAAFLGLADVALSKLVQVVLA
ncbi:MAG: preprotein translocase subunit SecE [Desulfamplus sp.]|nr:preprotein translocase subunit SecE [Desulfamplus sp.]